MQIDLLGISQDYSFDDNESVTFLRLKLTDGHEIRALVDEVTAQHVIRLHVGDTPPASAVQIPLREEKYAPSMPPGTVNSDEPPEFGGDVETSVGSIQQNLNVAERQIARVSPPSSELSPDAIRKIASDIANSDLPTPRWNSPKPRSVIKDDMGNPVLVGENLVDPGELVGGEDTDEDGVGQL